jgi:serine/threonine protein kinase
LPESSPLMSAVTLGPFHPGGSSGRYYPIAQLGRGGMSEVYLAIARGPAGFNKLVVIKRLLSGLVADAHFLDMFLDEARLAARLNHPNIVQTNEVGVADEKYFIAMEYLDGQPLLKIVQRSLPRALPVHVALGIAANVCAGLHYAHTLADFSGTPLGIVHRDVSPHNIFVTYAGQVKIVDFGIAKATSRTTETQAGILKGKIAYMSPEHIGGVPLDGRSDVFSAGVVLYETLPRRRDRSPPTSPKTWTASAAERSPSIATIATRPRWRCRRTSRRASRASLTAPPSEISGRWSRECSSKRGAPWRVSSRSSSRCSMPRPRRSSRCAPCLRSGYRRESCR